MTDRYKIATGLAGLVVLLDQAVKFWISNNIPRGVEKQIIPGFFNLVHVLNKGAAFGFLNRPDTRWQTYFLIGASVLAVLLVFHLLKTVENPNRSLLAALGLILGGAVGNMIDRIRFGQVVDFLDFYIGKHHWPAFNVADIAISFGAIFLLIYWYRRKRYASGSD